jgi:hypothetical protein
MGNDFHIGNDFHMGNNLDIRDSLDIGDNLGISDDLDIMDNVDIGAGILRIYISFGCKKIPPRMSTDCPANVHTSQDCPTICEQHKIVTLCTHRASD